MLTSNYDMYGEFELKGLSSEMYFKNKTLICKEIILLCNVIPGDDEELSASWEVHQMPRPTAVK